MYMTNFQLLRTSLMGEMPFAMKYFIQMTVYPTMNGHRGVLSVWDVAYLGSAAGLSCYVAKFA